MATHRVNVVAYDGLSRESVSHLTFEADVEGGHDDLLAAAERCVRDGGYRPYPGESSVRYDYGDGSLCIDVPVEGGF